MKRVEEEAFKRGYRIRPDGTLVKGDRVYHQKPDNRGYYKFQIYTREDGKRKMHVCHYHRLQAFQKYGDEIYKKGLLVRHLNDIKTDNSIDNISIGTYRDNALDMPKEKRMLCNQAALKALKKSGRLIPDEVKIAIREDHETGMGYRKLQKKYGHSLSGIVYICIHAKDL